MVVVLRWEIWDDAYRWSNMLPSWICVDETAEIFATKFIKLIHRVREAERERKSDGNEVQNTPAVVKRNHQCAGVHHSVVALRPHAWFPNPVVLGHGKIPLERSPREICISWLHLGGDILATISFSCIRQLQFTHLRLNPVSSHRYRSISNHSWPLIQHQRMSQA